VTQTTACVRCSRRDAVEESLRECLAVLSVKVKDVSEQSNEWDKIVSILRRASIKIKENRRVFACLPSTPFLHRPATAGLPNRRVLACLPSTPFLHRPATAGLPHPSL
jgi:hypothetical protein